ncbi:MAG TPA: methionyl-tRNA formyltransferase [Lachnospiraceae bacterium]|nr:methionyl-tRNA formyltransferase [Lachnospiraceae bacterium]
MKIVFMGTPDYAVGALEAIIKEGHEVCAVVTQPDKPKGRGKEMQCTPVKECAIKNQITVFQPIKIKTKEAVEVLRTYGADIFVVAAFGQILSSEILTMPKFGCINIHASLLPKYRGAAPIQWAILNGEKETGITIMQMDEGIDTGDMLLKSVIPIDSKETGESLFEKLSVCGAKLIVKALPMIEQGIITATPQNESEMSYAKMIHKSLGIIDWSSSACEIERKVRGLNSWPSAYTYLNDKTLKIWNSDILLEDSDGCPGSISYVTRDAIAVNTGNKQLLLHEIQIEGKKRMSVKQFLLGYQIDVGMVLGR